MVKYVKPSGVRWKLTTSETKNIKNYLKANHLKVKWLCNKLGISLSQFKDMYYDGHSTTPEVAQKLLELGVCNYDS